MQPTVAEQCGNPAIFKSREVGSKGGLVVLVDLESCRAVGREAPPAKVIGPSTGLPSLSRSLKGKADTEVNDIPVWVQSSVQTASRHVSFELFFFF